MSPTAQSDGHDGPGLLDELVPGIAAVIDEIIVAGEYPVGEPIVADELPNVFLRVELRAFGRQGDDADVGWHDELRRHVPSGLIEQQRGMTTWSDFGGDGSELMVHRVGVAPGKDQTDRLALRGTDGAEDVGGSGALI